MLSRYYLEFFLKILAPYMKYFEKIQEEIWGKNIQMSDF